MKKRNYSIDFLKAVCIIFVVLAHSVPLEYQKYVGRPFTIIQAVPIFLLITGYNFSESSFVSNRYSDIFSVFRYGLTRIKKLLLPFVILFITEALFMLIKYNYNFRAILKLFIGGGVGPGSYFVPVMIQTLLVLPILVKVTRKNPIVAVILIFVLNLLLEYLSLGVSDYWYRLLFIRYLFAIELGVFLSVYKDKINFVRILPFACISIMYIFCIDIYHMEFILNRGWGSQNPIAYFFALMIVYIFLHLKLKENEMLSSIGKKTYYICLVQKNYFFYASIYSSILNIIQNSIFALFISIYLVVKVLGKKENSSKVEETSELKAKKERQMTEAV